MTGYHYTSWDAWKHIQKEGLAPYPLDNRPELEKYDVRDTLGIWLWKNKLKGNSHIGLILWEVQDKKSLQIVLLKVQYTDYLKTPRGQKITLRHHGSIGDWVFHEAEPARIVLDTIPPENIELVGMWNLRKLLALDKYV
jgi:hypothetical protein